MAGNPFKLEFTLKQHTPLIHFQHDQEGATLRATELKPKLDRFIINELNLTIVDDNGEKPKDEFKSFFINDGKQHLALDYKVRVFPTKTFNFYLPLAISLNSRVYPHKEQNAKNYIQEILGRNFVFLSPSPFFSNSDKIKFKSQSNDIDRDQTKVSELEFGLLSKDEIQCQIISFKPELLKILPEKILLFFILHNFGKRQSKGFGSFSVKSVNGIQSNYNIDNQIGKLVQNGHVQDAYKKKSTTDVRKVFNNIDSIWKLLKSGVNHNQYKKSDLFNYFYNVKLNTRWEKRGIKQALKQNYFTIYKELKRDRNQRVNRILFEGDGKTEHFFIRGLLGLAEHNEYGVNGDGKILIKISNSSLENDEDVVDRFQSPVIFKVIDESLYLLTKKIPINLTKDIKGNSRQYDFTLTGIFEGRHLNQKLLSLTIPSGFRVSEFLDSLSEGGRTVAKSHGFDKINIK